jgi:hypothetical protein
VASCCLLSFAIRPLKKYIYILLSWRLSFLGLKNICSSHDAVYYKYYVTFLVFLDPQDIDLRKVETSFLLGPLLVCAR